MKRSERTREAYSDDLRVFADFLGVHSATGEHPLALVPDSLWRDLEVEHVAAYLQHLQTAVSARTCQPYSTATIARRMTALMELLTEAAFLGAFDRGRLEYLRDRLRPPPVTNEHHAGLSPEEQSRLLECADAQPGLKGLRDYAIFRVWLETGLRRAELAGLSVGDLVVKAGVPVLVVRHGKGDRVREISLESQTAAILQEWLRASGQAPHPKRPLFCQVRKVGRGERAFYAAVKPDRHLTGMALYKLVLWYADPERAAIESRISPHSFRVAMVTDALAGGASLQHVMSVGGWTTSRMPEIIYNRNVYREPLGRYRKRPLPGRRGMPPQGEQTGYTSNLWTPPPDALETGNAGAGSSEQGGPGAALDAGPGDAVG